ncbi:unnamed protein product [Chondrus crispus]|uniref:Uncharacterized protein n=1 Tax=Chondrus crispus TaxID=2769 RepID=R7Q9W2_CHOCR|nr:unnamed protein product [Chondrus crispus]XP_005715145.1 unnamed protein product [Chondrus crispus]CDF35322.1 unnamed protein product [Chondrus crispus]CDF35326.1 unnamed protein product [Chondrus crispus]|eukprot:XP_005715141.1 unnamed protein product [Chondrus crispus]
MVHDCAGRNSYADDRALLVSRGTRSGSAWRVLHVHCASRARGIVSVYRA